MTAPALLRVTRRPSMPTVTAVGSLGAGVGAGFVGATYGPAVIVVAPLAAAIAVASLTWTWLAPGLVVAVLPVGVQDVALGPVALELVEVAVIGAAALTVIARLTRGAVPIVFVPPLWWLVVLVGASVVGMAFASDSQTAIKQVGLLIGGSLLATTTLGACQRPEDIRRLAATLVTVGSVIAIATLQSVGELNVLYGGGLVTGRATGMFVQPNELGAFIALLLLVAFGLLVSARTIAGRIGGAGAVALLVAALALSLSRGAWFGAAVGLFAYLVLAPDAMRFAVRVGIPLVVLGVALVVPVLDEPPSQVEVVARRAGTLADPLSNPYDDRPAIWQASLRLISEAPLTGHGPGNFPEASARSVDSAQVNWSHAHNTVLTVATEVGVIGAIAVTGLAASVGAAAYRTARRFRDVADQRMTAALGAALASQLGHGLVDFPLRHTVVLMVTMLILGALLAMARTSRLWGSAI